MKKILFLILIAFSTTSLGQESVDELTSDSREQMLQQIYTSCQSVGAPRVDPVYYYTILDCAALTVEYKGPAPRLVLFRYPGEREYLIEAACTDGGQDRYLANFQCLPPQTP